MTLSDVFCRLNRARAIAGLISPEDLLDACKQLNKQSQSLKYNVYPEQNLHVLEIGSDNNQKLDEICQLIDGAGSMTAYGLSRAMGCSLIVARKHLFDGERIGRLCRDETSFGLTFYKNLFIIC